MESTLSVLMRASASNYPYNHHIQQPLQDPPHNPWVLLVVTAAMFIILTVIMHIFSLCDISAHLFITTVDFPTLIRFTLCQDLLSSKPASKAFREATRIFTRFSMSLRSKSSTGLWEYRLGTPTVMAGMPPLVWAMAEASVPPSW